MLQKQIEGETSLKNDTKTSNTVNQMRSTALERSVIKYFGLTKDARSANLTPLNPLKRHHLLPRTYFSASKPTHRNKFWPACIKHDVKPFFIRLSFQKAFTFNEQIIPILLKKIPTMFSGSNNGH